MDARLREAFLRELLIITHQATPTTIQTDTSRGAEEPNCGGGVVVEQNLANTNFQSNRSNTTANNTDYNRKNLNYKTGDSEADKDSVLKKKVNITLLGDSGSTGRTLSGLFVACDTNLTHILLNDLKTPLGTQSSALVRLNDVIAITYR